MMSGEMEIIAVLEQWRDALQEMADVFFDVEGGDFAEGLARRQEAITRIQDLDTQLRQISAVRERGWEGIDDATSSVADEIIAESNQITSEIMRRNSQDVEKANEIRMSYHRQIQNSSRGKGYLSALKGVTQRPPAIVDDRA